MELRDPAILDPAATLEAVLARATEVVPLGCPTREVWVRAALAAVPTLLDDHAQCELKAATNALALIGRHPEHDLLVRRMSSLAKEEMVHYRMVRQVLLDRDGTLSRPAPNPYMKGIGRDRLSGAYNLLDDLLVCALIEARSCERFVALVRGLRSFQDLDVPARDDLAAFYARLARSESGHATLFVRLAEQFFDPDLVRRELLRRSEIEAATIETLPVTPRMHGGHRQAA
jgi:tRNA-(ms[2]io[6]A)-hydroxylase